MVSGQERDKGTQFFGGTLSNSKGKFKCLACKESPPPRFGPLVGHPDLPIRKTLRRVLGLLTVILLAGIGESIFFIARNLHRVRLKVEKEWQVL